MKKKDKIIKENIQSYENIFIKNEFLEILSCPICQNVFVDPKRISCGHTFCNLCIISWLKNKNNCPLCRFKINKNGVSKDIIAEKIIHQLEVKCGFKGCPWEGRLEEYMKHKRNCYFEEGKIPFDIKKYYFTNREEDLNKKEDDINQNSCSLKERIYNKHKDLIDDIYVNKSNISTNTSNISRDNDHIDLNIIESLMNMEENKDNNKYLRKKRTIDSLSKQDEDEDEDENINEAIKRSLEDFN